MRRTLAIVGFLCLATTTAYAGRKDEITLFDQRGRPVAYVAEDLTIYLWSGKPVAYLAKERRAGFDIYGFNGKHLGWFVKGIVRDHDGAAAGGVKEVFRTPTETEPFKSFKEFKPFKAFREFAPMRPMLTSDWSDTPLKILLLEGAE